MRGLGIGKTIVYSILPLLLLLAVLECTFRVIEIWIARLPVDYGWGY